MARTIWIALVFLICICGLAGLKVSIATPAKQQEAFAEITIGANLEPVLSKADKLNASYVDDAAPDKKTVRLIPIALPNFAEPEPQEKASRIISRHWHEGDTKVPKGTARNHRDAAHAKRKELREVQSSPVETLRNWLASKKT
jgi:hypothetical protein